LDLGDVITTGRSAADAIAAVFTEGGYVLGARIVGHRCEERGATPQHARRAGDR